jgi:hypothetical protein
MGKFFNERKSLSEELNSKASGEETSSRSANGVGSVNVSKKEIASVLGKVTVGQYFKHVIEPQLGNYFELYPVDFENKPVACCPLHDEDTPSFRHYSETNTFYCFGCGKGGDVIKLHMYFYEKMSGNGIDYNSAAENLYDYFVKGKESVAMVSVSTLKKEKKSSNEEIIRLNLYRYNMEASFTNDKTIPLEVKKTVWLLLDNLDVLISKDIVSAVEAEEWLRKEIDKVIKTLK